MTDSSRSTYSDPRLWMTTAASNAPRKPPYPPDMWVTPLSQYKDNKWIYPLQWTAVNTRNRAVLDFEAESEVTKGFRRKLVPSYNDILIDQLKQATWASTYRRDAFPARRKRVVVKPGGAHNAMRLLRRLIVGFAHAGRFRLCDVDTVDLADTFALFNATNVEFEQLVNAFQDLIVLSRAGLIVDGLRELQFEIIPPAVAIPDQNAPLGYQPIPDSDVAKLIAVSNRYIELSDEIATKLEAVIARPDLRRSVVLWARSTLPCGDSFPDENVQQALASLVHIASANLISFHVGLRVSELLSILRGFVRPASEDSAELDCDRLELDFTTYKMIADFYGVERHVEAHPRLLVVSAALERIKEALGTPGRYLFVPYGDDLPYITNRFNSFLQRFCNMHDVQIDISSHMWRKTVAALAVRVLTGATIHLKELFGHAGLAAVARYILASPFIREEIRDSSLDEYRKRGLTLLESLSVVGGPGLGGRHGRLLEDRFAKLLQETDITEIDLRRTLDTFVEEMLRQGIIPIPVMPGVFCMKPLLARGECASSSGDRMADPAKCSARCSWQVQQAHRRGLVAWTIGQVAARRGQWSGMEETYWASRCRDQLIAWPDLEGELANLIESWPRLKALLGKPNHGDE